MTILPFLMCGPAMLHSIVDGCSHIEDAMINGVLGGSYVAFAPQAGTNAQNHHGSRKR